MSRTSTKPEEVEKLSLIRDFCLSSRNIEGQVIFALTDQDFYVDISTWIFEDSDYVEMKTSGFRYNTLRALGDLAKEREADGLEARGGLLNMMGNELTLEWMTTEAAQQLRAWAWENQSSTGQRT